MNIKQQRGSKCRSECCKDQQVPDLGLRKFIIISDLITYSHHLRDHNMIIRLVFESIIKCDSSYLYLQNEINS